MRAAIELIRSYLPPAMRDEIDVKLPISAEQEDFSVDNFSIGRLRTLEHYKSNLEMRLNRNAEVRAKPCVEKMV